MIESEVVGGADSARSVGTEILTNGSPRPGTPGRGVRGEGRLGERLNPSPPAPLPGVPGRGEKGFLVAATGRVTGTTMNNTRRTGLAVLCLGGLLQGPAGSSGFAAELRGEVTDAATGQPLAARIELQRLDDGTRHFVPRPANGAALAPRWLQRLDDGTRHFVPRPANGAALAPRWLQRLDDGTRHFVRSASDTAAVTYERKNWVNPRSAEHHTCAPAAPFLADGLAPGRYRLTVERGKEYFPETRELTLGDEPVTVSVPLRRWINLAERGWYSGETHIHRTLGELPVLLQAEDLNVALPLTYWVTKAHTPPTAGDRNMSGDIPDRLITVDATHVIWPRNTEYEIFTVGQQQHTLGALFVLNHKSVFREGVPPWGPVADQARAEGALLDMDKLDWPFAMTLPDSSGATLYELANNHLWRTEFAFRQWNTQAAPFLQPPYGGRSGDERAVAALHARHVLRPA